MTELPTFRAHTHTHIATTSVTICGQQNKQNHWMARKSQLWPKYLPREFVARTPKKKKNKKQTRQNEEKGGEWMRGSRRECECAKKSKWTGYISSTGGRQTDRGSRCIFLSLSFFFSYSHFDSPFSIRCVNDKNAVTTSPAAVHNHAHASFCIAHTPPHTQTHLNQFRATHATFEPCLPICWPSLISASGPISTKTSIHKILTHTHPHIQMSMSISFWTLIFAKRKVIKYFFGQ